MQEQIVQSKNVVDFFALSSEFCIYTQEIESYSLNHILNFYQKILPMLYIKASFLPQLEIDDIYAQTFVSDEQFENIMNTIRLKTEAIDFYFDLAHCHDKDSQLVYSFAYDIATLYRYISDFLNLFQNNILNSKLGAIDYAKKTFIENWGNTLLRLQKNIHANIYGSF